MKDHSALHLASLVMALALITGCQKEEEVIPSYVLKDLPSESRKNNVKQLPSMVHQHAGNSPIHWQPWTQESIDVAKDTHRMIFAVVAMAQAPGFAECLDALAEDRGLVEIINSTYLPILIDGDAAREIAILTADLSQEINQNLNLPFFIWMSPDANPVAWVSSPWVDADTTRDHFRRSHSMVSKIWEESPQYVLNNSAMDNEARAARISQRRMNRIQSDNPMMDAVRSIRQLASLYDPLSRNYDEIGGLFPSGTLDLLASAAMQPDIPADVGRRAKETTRELIKDLLGSAMFDPLDGGLFSARRGSSWSLPRHSKQSIMQSRAAVALFKIYHATGEPLALERAIGLMAFSETNYQTNDGLFAIGGVQSIDPHLWLWSIEDVETILGPEESKWWASLTGMKALGNIAYEFDPERLFFRGNSLALGKSLANLAAAEGLPLDEFSRRFESARTKMFAARAERLGKSPRDESPHAIASFRMASAYAAAFTATGDEAWRSKAVALLQRSREAFSEGINLRVHPVQTPASLNEARAFVYVVAIQAILDVADVTGDLSLLDWCDDLTTVLMENHKQDGFLREASEDASLLNLPMTDLMMLFEESTLGLLNFAEFRLAARGRPLMRELRELAGALPVSAVDFPVQHTDIVQAFLARHFTVTVVYGPETSRDLMERIERLPIRMFQRRPAIPGETLPANGCLVIRSSSPEPMIVTNSIELENAFLPNSTAE